MGRRGADRTLSTNRWTCSPCGKVAHPSRAAAKRTLHAMRGEGKDPDRLLRVYRCDTGAWHLGNLPSHRRTHNLNDPNVNFLEER